MKKIISCLLFLLMTFVSILLAGCSSNDSTSDAKILGMIPAYVGETVTDTQHTFSKDDFYVMVTYSDYNDQVVTDFTFEVKELKDGYYTILIKWKDWEEECYVPLEMNIYASDAETGSAE